MVQKWQLWFVPTEKGRRGFGWKEEPIGQVFEATTEEADLERYLHDAEEPAPDKHEYRRIELRKVNGD